MCVFSGGWLDVLVGVGDVCVFSGGWCDVVVGVVDVCVFSGGGYGGKQTRNCVLIVPMAVGANK